MLSARYSPLISQAEITGKGQPDLWSFNQRRLNSGDSMTLKDSYPGGDRDENLAIMPGELVVGFRKQAAHNSFHGRSQEAGFTSAAGLYYGDKSAEALMRDMYFMGVAKTEYQYGGDSLFGTDPMDHGFGFLRAGSMSVNNNSNDDVCAGDILAWRLPPTRNGDPGTQGMYAPSSIDSGLNPRHSNNRTGTPYGKPLIQIERFDPSDFSFQLAGSYSLFDKPASQGGVSDLGLKDMFGDKRKQLSSLQEEALGWKCGLLMVVARARADGDNFIKDINLVDGKLSADGRSILDAVFLRNAPPGMNQAAIGNTNYSALQPGNYDFYADHLFDMLCGAVAGGWYAKTSRIVGKAMGNAKSGQTLDVMFSHFKVGF